MTIFWVGLSVSPQILRDLFGVDDILQLDPQQFAAQPLPVLETRLSAQVRNILHSRAITRGGRQTKMVLARQGTDGTELEFGDCLVEDQNNAATSYVDYLCQIHKQIHTVVSDQSVCTHERRLTFPQL
jgi:protein transport protein SEC24